MTLKKNDALMDLEIPENISGLFHRYHDRFFADDSLSDLNVLLLSLYLIEQKNKKSGVSYGELKGLFVFFSRREENFRKVFYDAKRQGLVDEEGEEISFRAEGLKRIRRVIGQTEKAPVYIIKSGANFTAIKLFEEFLTGEIKDDEILLCDPYISSFTLYPLCSLKGKVKNIKILTSNIHDEKKFKEYKKRFEKEMGTTVEIKVSNKIHDRYLLCADKCWSLGTSIKDLGNKDTMIKELDDVKKSLRDLFLERWGEASFANL